VSTGVVEIKEIAREPGSRTKVAVMTTDEAIDPIGSCIGQRGTRIQTIIRELNGEKVDVIQWSDSSAEFIKAALSPAKVIEVTLKDDEHLAVVAVAPDQLSLAIGKGGQNVRLAAKLVGWKITIVEQGGKVVADSEIGEVPGPEAEKPETAAEADLKEKKEAVEPLEGAAEAVVEKIEEQAEIKPEDGPPVAV
jgi:N utilization substance protein A